MEFSLKYFGKFFTGILRKTKPHHVIVPMIAWIMIINGFRQFSLPRILIGAACGLVFTMIWYVVGSIIIVSKNAKIYGVLDRCGFSVEYLRVFEKERIIGKPFNLVYAIEYAEIFMNIGKPDEAIRYLNTITIPEGANDQLRVAYFFVYVMSALKINNLEIADDMWRRNMELINRVSANLKAMPNSLLIPLSLIYIDCFAHLTNGDQSRLQRAYEQTKEILSRGIIEHECDFDIIHLYELKKLGRLDEFNTLLPQVREKVNVINPMFTCIKDKELSDLEKVCNGIFPI